ncbi:MAG: SWF/SNF helicase family protein, partial [Bacteroidetes bacterium]|nr:SWF/SNF helicase family protein [Bacteroidota bacterium]
MMERHRALHSLSHDHHHGLILAQLIKKGSPQYKNLPNTTEGKKDYSIRFYNYKLIKHFEDEEKILFPVVNGKNDEIDNLIEESIDSNGKVLLFSDLKQDVTDKLKDRFSKYGAVIIDGDVSSDRNGNYISEREEIRRKFQRDPDCKVLIATTVMDEGVDLTAATDLIHLTLPYTPSAFEQRNRRAQRIGEVMKDYVNVHVVKPKMDDLPVITEGIQR